MHAYIDGQLKVYSNVLNEHNKSGSINIIVISTSGDHILYPANFHIYLLAPNIKVFLRYVCTCISSGIAR